MEHPQALDIQERKEGVYFRDIFPLEGNINGYFNKQIQVENLEKQSIKPSCHIPLRVYCIE